MKTVNAQDIEIYEMANLSKEKSGLPYNIWIDSAGSQRKVQHNEPRIKVDITGNLDLIPVTIDKVNPKNVSDPYTKIPKFSLVSKWVIKNYEILIKHWNQIIDDEDTLRMLRKDYKGD